MEIRHPQVGVCGLSCRLCPRHHTDGRSRCDGCKTDSRMSVGCSLITCAVEKKGVEFCWSCGENSTCAKWMKHRLFGQQHDSLKCYRTLEEDVSSIQRDGIDAFEKLQETRERLLMQMLRGFNEGRSKSYYCIAATVLDIDDLRRAVSQAQERSEGLETWEKAEALHSILDAAAEKRGYSLKLRK